MKGSLPGSEVELDRGGVAEYAYRDTYIPLIACSGEAPDQPLVKINSS